MIEFKTIGADPEFALRKGSINVPAFHYFKGTKQHPEDKGNGFAILRDNLLVEGNIPPASDLEEFYRNMTFIQDLISSIVNVDGTGIYYQDLVKYNKRFIYTDDGMEFGCSSYNDAWSQESKPSPVLTDTFFRPVGNHIHLGYEMKRDDIDPMQMNEWLARAYDYFVSLPADTIHFSKERRENYGAYGSYRDTKYGVEFRSLGGYFLQRRYLIWIYEQVQKTVEFCKSEDNCQKLASLTQPSYDDYEFLGIELLDQVPGGINLEQPHRRNNLLDNVVEWQNNLIRF